MTTPDHVPDVPPEDIDRLHKQMDDLYDSMQTPANRDAVDRAFRMTPAQMAELLREVYGPEPVLELHDAEHEDLKDADSSE